MHNFLQRILWLSVLLAVTGKVLAHGTHITYSQHTFTASHYLIEHPLTFISLAAVIVIGLLAVVRLARK